MLVKSRPHYPAQIVVLENATHQFDVFGSSSIRDVIDRFLQGEPVLNKIVLVPIMFE